MAIATFLKEREMVKKPETSEICLEHLTTAHLRNVFDTSPVAVQKHLTTDHLRQALQTPQSGQVAQPNAQSTSQPTPSNNGAEGKSGK